MKLFKDYILGCDKKKAIRFATNKHEKKDRKNIRAGYEYVFEKLLRKRKRKSDFKIIVEYVDKGMPGDEDFEPYFHVGGQPLNKKDRDESGLWAIEFTPWSVWLGSELIWDGETDKMVKERGIEFAIAECLWEMTFAGFKESRIRYKVNSMNKAVKDIESGKSKGKEYISVDELFESLTDDKKLVKEFKDGLNEKEKEETKFKSVFDTKPLSVNEKGVKFWFDELTTNYAGRRGLKGYVSFFVETKEGHRTHLLTKDQEPVLENQSLEGIGCDIDMLALKLGVIKH